MKKDSEKIEVYYDADIFLAQSYGGIRTYFNNLISNFKVDLESKFKTRSYKYLNLNREKNKFSFSFFNKKLVLILSFIKPIFFKNEKKVYHATYVRNLFFRNPNIKKIITVHDMIHELYPTYFDRSYQNKRKFYVLAKKLNIFNASGIITISESTKKDLLKVYPQIEKEVPIKVIHHGGDHLLKISDKNFHPIKVKNDNNFLYIGARTKYKGFKDLLEALGYINQYKYNFQLTCIGSNFSKKEQYLIFKYKLENLIKVINPNDKELCNIYKLSSALIYPSWYEGFGLPILEAMNFNIPVICSNISSSKEIGKEYVSYFKKKSVPSLVNSLIEFLDNKSNAYEKLSSSKNYLKEMTWFNCYKKTIDFYSKFT